MMLLENIAVRAVVAVMTRAGSQLRAAAAWARKCRCRKFSPTRPAAPPQSARPDQFQQRHTRCAEAHQQKEVSPASLQTAGESQ